MTEPAQEYPVASEEAYWRFCNENFQKALAWIIRHHWETVKDQGTATELVQDAFTTVFERRATIHKNPLAVVINKLKDLLKEHRSREMPVGSLGLRSDDTHMGDFADHTARTASSVVGRREMDELFTREGIESLQPEFRRPFELARNGKRYREVAEIMGISAAAVQKRVETAAGHLIICMVKYMPDLARRVPGAGKQRPIRAYARAREAIERLPMGCRNILTLVYVQRFPIEDVWSQAGFASVEEAKLYLAEGLDILQTLYEQKMPDELVMALSQRK